MPKKRTIRFKILKIFGLLFLLTFSAVSLVYYSQASKVVLGLSDKVVRSLNQSLTSEITNYILEPSRMVREVASFAAGKNIIGDRDEIWEFMWYELRQHRQIEALFIGDRHGNYIQTRRNPELATRLIHATTPEPSEVWLYRDSDYRVIGEEKRLPKFDPRMRPWYLNAIDKGHITLSNIFVFTTSKLPGVSISTPIYSEDGVKTATVGSTIPLNQITDFLTRLKGFNNSQIFILNSKNEIIAYQGLTSEQLLTRKNDRGEFRLTKLTDVEDLEILEATVNHRVISELKSNFSEQKFFTTLIGFFVQLFSGNVSSYQELFLYGDFEFSVTKTENGNLLTYAAPLLRDHGFDWTVYVVTPESDVFGAMHDMRNQAGILGIFSLIISVFCMHFLARKISVPISNLVLQTEKIKKLQLNEITQIPTDIKEVDSLNLSISATAQSLRSFKKYVPDVVMKDLVSMQREVTVGGGKEEIAIMFTDIANFTTISETMSPSELSVHLSEYFECIVKVISKYGGIVDKYIGDASMSFWRESSEVSIEEQACLAALEIESMLTVKNNEWNQLSLPLMITRIGLNSGETIVGNIGSSERMNFTVIGDSINLASRIEELNKFYGTSIIVSSYVRDKVEDKFYFRKLDKVAVKGKENPVEIYELVSGKTNSLLASDYFLISEYEAALERYFKKDWNAAVELFNKILKFRPDDLASALMVERCLKFKMNPESVGENWNGSVKLSSK